MATLKIDGIEYPQSTRAFPNQVRAPTSYH